jgi:hypothetical protein
MPLFLFSPAGLPAGKVRAKKAAITVLLTTDESQ